MSSLGLLRLATVCLGLVACGSPTDATHSADVTAAVDRADIEPERPAHITVMIANRGTSAVLITQNDACAQPYLVRTVFGDDVPLPGRFCIAAVYPPRSLAPGESMTLEDQWTGERDGAGRAAYAAPGRYQILARIQVDGRELHSGPVWVRVH